MKFAVIGYPNEASLAASYCRAITSLGHEHILVDINAMDTNYARLGAVGRKLHQFLSVPAWTRKANRDTAITINNYRPDAIIVIGNMRVNVGALAFLKVALKCKIIWVWPDTLLNMEPWLLQAAGMIDVFASYSSQSLTVLNEMGFRNAQWIPLAADMQLHHYPLTIDDAKFTCDLSFVGGCRPEREQALLDIITAFPNLNVQIFGPLEVWKRQCKSKKVLARVAGDSLFGKDFSAQVAASRINLNVIDDTNYPSANMRFFEVSAAGGLQLVSTCPEMEAVYKDKESMLYFNNKTEMLQNIEWAISHLSEAQQIRQNVQALTSQAHTYEARLQTIINHF